ncbi:MAG: FMN-binding glutamate synthase family protein [Bryobacterales bacterium]
MCAFIAKLRDLSGGKPVGFKLCVGLESEFYSICKAMIETGVIPDFITVDGGEGGTGAAPVEFSDSVGMPLHQGLNFVHQTLIGCGLRDRVFVAASGKVYSASSLLRVLVMGADWANAARAFMMAVGCIQAQMCHTNRCPVGVTTLDKSLQRGLVPEDKAERVYHFHHNTLEAFRQILEAMGVSQPKDVDARFLPSPARCTAGGVIINSSQLCFSMVARPGR